MIRKYRYRYKTYLKRRKKKSAKRQIMKHKSNVIGIEIVNVTYLHKKFTFSLSVKFYLVFLHTRTIWIWILFHFQSCIQIQIWICIKLMGIRNTGYFTEFVFPSFVNILFLRGKILVIVLVGIFCMGVCFKTRGALITLVHSFFLTDLTTHSNYNSPFSRVSLLGRNAV
jgi:hypothetical protein